MLVKLEAQPICLYLLCTEAIQYVNTILSALSRAVHIGTDVIAICVQKTNNLTSNIRRCWKLNCIVFEVLYQNGIFHSRHKPSFASESFEIVMYITESYTFGTPL